MVVNDQVTMAYLCGHARRGENPLNFILVLNREGNKGTTSIEGDRNEMDAAIDYRKLDAHTYVDHW